MLQTFGADSFQENASRFIIRVLRHQLASERDMENGLTLQP